MLRISRNVPRADTDVLEACVTILWVTEGTERKTKCSQDPNREGSFSKRLLRPGTPWGGRAVASRTFTLRGWLAVDRTQTRPRPGGQQGAVGSGWLPREHVGPPAPSCRRSRWPLWAGRVLVLLGQRHICHLCPPKVFYKY